MANITPRTTLAIVPTAAAVALALVLVAPASAQQTTPPPGAGEVLAQAPGEAATQEADPAEAERRRRNELALILAGTWESEPEETTFTAGLEYERRFTRTFGFSLEAEYLIDSEAWVVAAPLVFRPGGGGFKLIAGPGFESKPRGRTHHVPPCPLAQVATASSAGCRLPPADEGRDNSFLLRVGAGYGAEFAERSSVTLFVNFDLIDEREAWVHALVFGVAIGAAF